jgi:NifB/MoaA-like Fe-S oxidoreductase
VAVALRPRPGTATRLVTGALGAGVLAPLLPTLTEVAGAPVELLTVTNRFFGGNIGVTGLLTGADVADALASVDARTRVLVPDVVLSNGRFLDGATVDELPRPVEVIPTDGASLVRALVPA